MAIGNLIGSYLNRNKSKNSPILNENNLLQGNNNFSISYYNYKKVYMTYYKTVAELTALINMVATDMNEDYYFEPVNKKDGRNRVLKAMKFAKDVNLDSTNFSTFIDILVTGEGYGWIGKINKELLGKMVSAKLKEKGANLELINKSLEYLNSKEAFLDEDVLVPKKYRYVASTTVENKYDEHEVTGFVQRVGVGNEVLFSKDEVVHYKFYDLDGKVSGFTCVGAIVAQLELLKFMWQNQTAIAKNGGHMDKIISVEDVDVNSAAYKRIEQELRKYNLNYQSRHGTLLLNGKVKVEELSQLDSMQFKEMGLYITGLMAMQWNVPRARIPFIVGGTNTQADTGGNSEVGYWKFINTCRRLYLRTINTQLWIPLFGVEMKFRDTYNNQDLLLEQKTQTKLNNITFMNGELMKAGKKFSAQYLTRVFNGGDCSIEDDDLEEHDPMEAIIQEAQGSMFRQGLKSNNELSSSSDKKNVQAKKKSEASAVSRARGQNNGFGKEVLAGTSSLTKNVSSRLGKEVSGVFSTYFKEDIQGKEVQEVSWSTFLQLYNEDKAFNKEPPRVFYTEEGDFVKLIYKSTDFVYETSAPVDSFKGIGVMNFIKLYKVDASEIRESVVNVASGNAVVPIEYADLPKEVM